MNPKTIKKLVIGGAIFVVGLIFVLWGIGVSNQEVALTNLFKAKKQERVAYYDNIIFKSLSGKAQVALRNDSSFRTIVDIQMKGQKDGEQVTWKWIQQSNPTATYGEVSALYKDLSRAIEGARNGFVQQEKTLMDIVLQHDNLRKRFPSSLIVGRRKALEYKPITSDRTDKVFETGKDNNTSVFQ